VLYSRICDLSLPDAEAFQPSLRQRFATRIH
jgi:hypothetical protein